MASESIKILIEAEDKASGQVAAASKNIEQAVKGVKETGQKAKGSIEFVGVLAGQLGGGQLQTAAQGVAAITEKVGQFSEVMKAGGKGAAFFQAGIAALVGVMSFSLGKSIGEAIFGVKDLAAELENAATDYEQTLGRMKSASDQKFEARFEVIQFGETFETQQIAARKLFDEVKKAQDDATASAAYYAAEAEKILATANPYLGKLGEISDEEKDRAKQLQAQADQHREMLPILEQQLQKISAQYGPRARALEQAKKQKAIDENSLQSLKQLGYQFDELTKGKERARASELRDQGVSESDAKAILMMEGLIAKEKQLQAQKEKTRQAEISKLDQMQSLAKGELDKLKEQKIALEQGEQAAHAFRLQQQGLDKDTSEAIAAAQAAMDASAKAAGQKVQPAAALQATESRLMIRGPKEDSQKKIEQNTKMSADQTKALNTAFAKLSTTLEKTQGERFVLERAGQR